MNLTTLFRLPPGMRLLTVILEPAALIVEAAARRGRSPCPSCQTLSDRVHSHYTRTVADLPCCGRHVILRLHVRKWRCTNAGCPQRIFTERFPDYLQPWARKTLRVAHLIAALGLAEGGRAAGSAGPRGG